MKLTSIASTAVLVSAALATARVDIRSDTLHDDEQAAAALIENIKTDVLQSLDERAADLHNRGKHATCTRKNIVFRRE